ncbi:MAG: signal peptide peptidase SppA, partial [Acidobacteriota bacterium]
GHPHTRGEKIALVYGVGSVMRGEGGYDPLGGEFVMGSDTVARALRAAADDEDVRAIVFRVSSPGGSYVASDTIWRETIRAQQQGKPVIVSMGDVAASGGYFVSMHADKIVAQPGTITASIGVLAGKLITDGLWRKIGIHWDDVQAGANASIWSPTHDYDEKEYARFQAALDRIYEDFTSKVADGRGLPLETVQQIAKGRVWSGEDALRLGLVDQLGGWETALKLARDAAGIESAASIRLERFPRRRGFFEALRDEGPPSGERAALAALERLLSEVRPLARLAKRLGLREPRGVLTASDLPGSEETVTSRSNSPR